MDIDMAKELYLEENTIGERLSLSETLTAKIIGILEVTGIGDRECKIIRDAVSVLNTPGREEEAVLMLKEAVDNDQMEKWIAGFSLFNAGKAYQKIRDFTTAEFCYRNSLNIHIPDWRLVYWLFNNLAFCQLYQRRFDEAEKRCRIAIKYNRKGHDAWKNLGVSLEHQQKTVRAMNAYQRAVKRAAGSDPRPRMHLDRFIKRQKLIIEGKMINEGPMIFDPLGRITFVNPEIGKEQ